MIRSMAMRIKSKIPFGCLFWLLFILLIAVLFYLNRETISFVLDKTNARSIFFKNKEEKLEQPAPVQEIPVIQVQADADTRGEAGDTSSETPLQEEAPKPADSEAQHSAQPAVPEADSAQDGQMIRDNSLPDKVQKVEDAATEVHTAAVTENVQTELRKTVLYWIRVDADGKLSRQTAIRMLPKSDAPMSDALAALFSAPSMQEAKQGLRTLVPPGTKLRSAWVKDGTAFINVSDEFQFNQYGIEGALAQLSQVVFTVTEFSTVKSVQFLIEGQKKEYLGAEGVWIGSPLSRISF